MHNSSLIIVAIATKSNVTLPCFSLLLCSINMTNRSIRSNGSFTVAWSPNARHCTCWHLFIMTSQSNCPSNNCAIVTSKWKDVKKPHGKQHVLNFAKGQLFVGRQYTIIKSLISFHVHKFVSSIRWCYINASYKVKMTFDRLCKSLDSAGTCMFSQVLLIRWNWI